MDILEYQKNTSGYQKRHPWEIARAKIIYYLIKKQGKHFKHLLDTGSGDAYVLHNLYVKGVAQKYTAVDTAYNTEIIEKINPENYEISFAEIFPNKLNPAADMVLLLDVIEHCEDDAAILQQINQPSIAQDFTLLITVPAFQSVFSRHDELLLHYRRYSINSLKRLCISNKLKPEEEGYFFFSLLLIRYLQLFLEKLGLRKPDHSIDNWKGSKWITSLYVSLLWLDFMIGRIFNKVGIRLPGLSAYCLCHPLPS